MQLDIQRRDRLKLDDVTIQKDEFRHIYARACDQLPRQAGGGDETLGAVSTK
jgi:hypothetical protein